MYITFSLHFHHQQFSCEEIKEISDVVPHHAISSWICVKFRISSLISKSPNFIFIGIHYGGVV